MSEDSGSGTIQIVPVEPGWIVIHFTQGNAAPERRFHLLHQALLKWQSTNLHCRLQNIESIHEKGELRGLNVFYSRELPPTNNLVIQVDAEIAKQYGSEYLEAVIADVVNFIASHPQGPPTLAVINRRHIAVVVDRESNSAYVVNVEKIESAIPPEPRTQLRNWLANPTTHQFATELPRGFRPK